MTASISWFEALDRYERLYARAVSAAPIRHPWLADDRAEIRESARRALGIRDAWIPSVRTMVARAVPQAGFTVEQIHFSSWPAVYGSADLYLPSHTSSVGLPVVLLCTGHGKGGRYNLRYRAAARRLVDRGAAVLIPDLIGQGDRSHMEHSSMAPFACGLSMQGLIVMEALGWVEWLVNDGRFDRDRIGAIGNSGGGTLVCFLGALTEKLAAVSCSGYPSTFDYIARCKERSHCACNVIPDVIGDVEMWQILSCISPTPLLLFQGEGDPLFPKDLFMQVARRVGHAYDRSGVASRFEFEVLTGGHEWDDGKIARLGRFMVEQLGLEAEVSDDHSRDLSGRFPDMSESSLSSPLAPPNDAIATGELVTQLTGQPVSENVKLWEIFPPRYLGHPLDQQAVAGGTYLQVAAQLEAFLATAAQ